jgi:hypothetical protein
VGPIALIQYSSASTPCDYCTVQYEGTMALIVLVAAGDEEYRTYREDHGFVTRSRAQDKGTIRISKSCQLSPLVIALLLLVGHFCQ